MATPGTGPGAQLTLPGGADDPHTRARELRERGFSTTAIGRKLGVSHTTARQLLIAAGVDTARHGMPAPRPGEHPLRTLRRERWLTQQDIALGAGCTKGTVSEIERGARPPSHDLACRIADVLSADVEQVFGMSHTCGRDGCDRLTFSTYCKGHALPSAAIVQLLVDATSRRVLDLERYCKRRGLEPTTKFAARIGRDRSTLNTAVREGRLPAPELYPGEWSQGSSPRLWRVADAELVESILRSGRARSRDRWWDTDDGRAFRVKLRDLKREWATTDPARAQLIENLAKGLDWRELPKAAKAMRGRHAKTFNAARAAKGEVAPKIGRPSDLDDRVIVERIYELLDGGQIQKNVAAAVSGEFGVEISRDQVKRAKRARRPLFPG